MAKSLWIKGESLLINPDGTLVLDDHCCCEGHSCEGFEDCANCENSPHFTSMELTITGFEDGFMLPSGDGYVNCLHSAINGSYSLEYDCEEMAFIYYAAEDPCGSECDSSFDQGIVYMEWQDENGGEIQKRAITKIYAHVTCGASSVEISEIGFECHRFFSWDDPSNHCGTGGGEFCASAGGTGGCGPAAYANCPPVINNIVVVSGGEFTACHSSLMTATAEGSKCGDDPLDSECGPFPDGIHSNLTLTMQVS